MVRPFPAVCAAESELCFLAKTDCRLHLPPIKTRSIRINCTRCSYNLNVQHLTRLCQTRYRNTPNTDNVIALRLGVFEGIAISIADKMQSKAITVFVAKNDPTLD